MFFNEICFRVLGLSGKKHSVDSAREAAWQWRGFVVEAGNLALKSVVILFFTKNVFA